MPLRPGLHLGPYEIVAPIGAGGMGEVYRAHDSRLNRDVAIKVLPESMGADAERLVRFAREAQLLAALNHPNIAQVYGVEDSPISGTSGPNVRALVMELVEGPTLDALVRPAGLPADVAIPIARQIAEALEAAHEHGIIHRDLKPANIKVRADDTVKVLDFGLAKAMEPAAISGPAIGQATTMASPAMTAHGVILGTAAYMSPEQARGKVVDKRTDIWAFGCVLFEMLSGHTLFGGETVSDVLASILAREPDWCRLPASVPPHLRALLGRCLERDPRKRLRDIGEARLALDVSPPAAPPPVPVETGPAVTPVRRTSRVAIALAALLGAALATGVAWWAFRAPTPGAWAGVRLVGPTRAYNVRLSPDGQLLAFLTFVDQLPQLAVMKPDAQSWTVLTHDRENGYIATVAWAPDGSRIYFDRLWGQPLGVYSIPALGGEPRQVLEDAFGPEALSDGSLVVLKLTTQGDEQLVHFWPDSGKQDPLPAFIVQTDIAPMVRAFPDGKSIVFWGMAEAGRSESPRLLVYDLASRTTREFTPGRSVQLSSSWAPLEVASDGQSVVVLADRGDTRVLTETPRTAGSPRPLISFPNSAPPVSSAVARDGSIYLDELLMPGSVLHVSASGGLPEEFQVQSYNAALVAGPDDVVLFDMMTSGQGHLASQRFGAEPRLLVDTPERTGLPATTFDGQVAFVLGSGRLAHLALASLRDGHILRQYAGRPTAGLSVSPDRHTLYYASDGVIWAQPVAGGDPKRVTEGSDVVVDRSGRYLYLKRSRAGVLSAVRFDLTQNTAEELPTSPAYHLGRPDWSSAAVDARGRLLVSVVSAHSFYYETAILDPSTKGFTLVPVSLDGDVDAAGWATDGSIVAGGRRYLLSLWHYTRSASLK